MFPDKVCWARETPGWETMLFTQNISSTRDAAAPALSAGVTLHPSSLSSHPQVRSYYSCRVLPSAIYPTSNLQNPEWRNSNTPSGLAMDCCWSIRTTSTIYQTLPPPARWRESLRPALALYSMGSLREFIMVALTSH